MVLVNSKFSMRFGGVELMQWIDGVTNIDRNIGQNRTTSLLKVAHTNGERFQYTTAAHGTITVTALIFTDIHRRELAQALMSDKPQQLIFGDEPDKYYQAIVDGQSTVAEAYYNNILTITFIVPDGIAHSVATQTADNMPYKDVPVNLYTDTSNFDNSYVWNNFDGWTKTGEKFNGLTVMGTTSDWLGLGQNAQAKKGEIYTFSVYARYESGTGNSNMYFSPLKVINADPYHATFSLNEKWQRFTGTFTVTADGPINARIERTTNNTNTLLIAGPKLEIGNAASPWSPNPADPEYYADTVTVHNGGTYPVYPVIEATMHSDNGVVTLINESNGGVIQLGNPGEVDGVQAPASETVFHYDLISAPSGVEVNTGKINYPTYPYGPTSVPNTIAGSWDYSLNKDAATPILNRTAAMRWAGPTFHGPIKANAAGVNTGNLIWSNRFNVVTSVGALGRVEFNLQSGNDIAICFVMRDSTYAADMLTVEGWVNGQNIFSQDLNRKLFTNGFYEIVESKLGNTTTFKLTKIKQLSASGVISSAQTVFPPVTIDGVADTPIDSFTVWMAGFSNKTGWTINWSDSVFQWVNVDYWKDLPNRFADGDVLLIDPSQIKVFVNNVEDRTLHAIDNDWEKFRLDPGDTNIKIITSDFAATPTVVATYREAFL